MEAKLVVEADGGQHTIEGDAARTAYLEGLGWKILRFWNNDILQQTDAVLEVILSACRERSNPLP